MDDGLPLSRPDMTALLARGVTRMLVEHGLAPILEVPLANGRRADVMALTPQGEIWIVETKSCLEDYACDCKWPDYVDYCDRFFFGVTETFPRELIPEECGLIVADGFGGAILRDSPVRPLAGARRKAVTLLFARLAALRAAAVLADQLRSAGAHIFGGDFLCALYAFGVGARRRIRAMPRVLGLSTTIDAPSGCARAAPHERDLRAVARLAVVDDEEVVAVGGVERERPVSIPRRRGDDHGPLAQIEGAGGIGEVGRGAHDLARGGGDAVAARARR